VREARYDAVEKAYVVAVEPGASTVSIRLDGSEASPLVNPAFILEGWAPRNVDVAFAGERLARGATCRIGLRHHAEASDLIVWLERTATAAVTVSFTHVE
jgi:hypothetical protein